MKPGELTQIFQRKSDMDFFGIKNNPVSMGMGAGIALPIGQGHNKGMLPLDSRPSKDYV